MGHIAQTFIQDLLSRTDIVSLVRTRVNLKKRGDNYLCLCPFHNEKTPSFTVSANKQFYYCFGCGAHGNAINFLMAFDRMEFIEVITDLANQQGLEIPIEIFRRSKPAESDDYYTLLANISRYYQHELRHASVVIDYLKSRGLTGEIARRFAIGYAPPGWENFRFLIKTPKIQSQLIANGLMIKKENHCFDRFRHRVMFPIRDVRGRVIAFGGRALGDDQPKYMNSPETPIFRKGNELYGLYEARKVNRELQHILVVEGYMDVISLHQHQITYAVATLGTATSVYHLQKLLRYTNKIIYCFDGDEAGRRAAFRALTKSLPLMRDGIHIRFLFLPVGEDPDSIVQKIGQKAFEIKIKQALPLEEMLFQSLEEEIPIRSLDDKAHFAKRACEYLDIMPQGIFRQFLLNQVAKRLGTNADQISSLLLSISPSLPYFSAKKCVLSTAYRAIAVLLKQPELIIEINPLPDFDGVQAPGVELLLKLITTLKNFPTISIGILLEQWDDEAERQYIAQLAAHQLPIATKEGLLAELKGALSRLQEQKSQDLATALINKLKTHVLTPEEKKRLQKLLMKSTIDLI
ncbi:DNA primase [Coxiella endosymbiont of Amblyomma nuttalli]|uniref:DNA primase n=1 Tax=Coxiella endosymbiont of Amblyomma nuttalli TaxID=2749996 RepID=UPI001BAE2A2B|nr:DNA primase [Coxiella endosymbiont of Amblyomma nuttalli]QTS83623.1 DNA primase [Coxiella endosymbiont of Amblyomma nuttalli]